MSGAELGALQVINEFGLVPILAKLHLEDAIGRKLKTRQLDLLQMLKLT